MVGKSTQRKMVVKKRGMYLILNKKKKHCVLEKYFPSFARSNLIVIVIKRQLVSLSDGREEEVHYDKITSRIQKLCYGLDMDHLDPVSLF